MFHLRSNGTATALAKLNTNDIWTRNQQAIIDMIAERRQQSANLETDRAADTQSWLGGKVIKGSEWLGGAVRTGLSDSKTGRQTLQGRVAGSVIELGGGAYGLYQQYQSIQNRADGKQRALTEAFDTRIVNQETASWSLVQNQGYRLDLQANRITYDGAVKAATQVHDASFEAARLRALSTVVSAVGHNIARDMEQGLALRY